MRELDFADQIQQAGGKAYVVGGWVRDTIRGAMPNDKDYVVTGINEVAFESLFPDARRVGRHFPVYRLRVGAGHCDVAFARREKKAGRGYRGFAVKFDRSISIHDDLERRDTTINSMAIPIESGSVSGLEKLIDPFGGARDIERRIIRATSAYFTDDPVRALRAARQSTQLGYSIESGTMKMMKECQNELWFEPQARIMHELRLVLETNHPSVFFRALLESDLLDVVFPWLYSLVGAEGDENGDAFARAMLTLDRAAVISDRPEIRFAALACHIGGEYIACEKTDQDNVPQFEELEADPIYADWLKVERRHADRWQAEKRKRAGIRQIDRGRTAAPAYRGLEAFLGLEALKEWNSNMTLPGLWMACAKYAIKEGSRAWEVSRPGEIADFLTRLERHPIGVDGLVAVIHSNGEKLPAFLRNVRRYYDAMRDVSGHDIPEDLAGSKRGKWLRARRNESIVSLLRGG